MITSTADEKSLANLTIFSRLGVVSNVCTRLISIQMTNLVNIYSAVVCYNSSAITGRFDSIIRVQLLSNFIAILVKSTEDLIAILVQIM